MFCCLVNDSSDRGASGVLEEIARACSPRVQIGTRDGIRAAIFDASGLDRAIGTPAEIGAAVEQLAAARGAVLRVALARTGVTAWLLAHACEGVTIATGDPRAALAPLPIGWLAALPAATGDSAGQPPATRGPGHAHGARTMPRRPARHYRVAPGPAREGATALIRRQDDLRRAERDAAAVLERWGIRTLGDLARLPRGDVHARLGLAGVRLHQAACGEDAIPLVPVVEAARFVERLQLEWPIEGLEPLSFVLGRLLEPLSAQLERRDRGAAVLHVRLHLTTREVYERSLQLPAPMRDARTLRTLVLLDLESHPPSAAIDRVTVAVDPTPGRVVQFSLLTRPVPSPAQVSTLMARLNALMGEGRCGSPSPVDSWQPGAFAMAPFTPRGDGLRVSEPPWCGTVNDAANPAVALRRFRFPVPARVRLEDGKPGRVTTDRRGVSGGRVETCAGPWRTSGGWWRDAPSAHSWDRDEWDVRLSDGATYRLFREREGGQWFVEAIVD